ncbi:uncharacterized protein VTP21DRAFT_7213 [Calcarisporiella thermophila]|uniref:uncharacterized protein n=1 Tax=Calcarisporiella thermophila TaxID=911321 RepID=UPI0037447698
MAFRLLAGRLTTRHLGARKAYRNFATASPLQPLSSILPMTRITTLPNGLTVATEENLHAQTATVGVWIDAGSRAENDKNNGAAHFLEHMAFKGTSRRSQHDLEIMIENMGAHLNAYTSREQTVYYAKAFKKDVPAAVEILADILQNSTLDLHAIERERDVILREQEEVEKQTEEVVFDHLHAVAFQGHSLGRTILGPTENIRSLKRDDLLKYIKDNYTADRMVLVGAGGVEHERLVELAGQYFGSLKSSPKRLNLGAHTTPHPKFVGAEARVRKDLPNVHVALAVEGIGWTSPDYYPMLVMQSIIGSWDRSLGASSRLSQVLASSKLANSFMSFNTSYSDTGLFGIYLVTEKHGNLDDLIALTQREWIRLSSSVTAAEVERAKQQLKASLLLSLDGSTAIAEDIGRQLITCGKRFSPEEVEALVDKVTAEDVRRSAKKYLWDRDVAVVTVGPKDEWPDVQRIRANQRQVL